MSVRPEDLPWLDQERLKEIRRLVETESSVRFTSARAAESVWMLIAFAERGMEWISERVTQPPTPPDLSQMSLWWLTRVSLGDSDIRMYAAHEIVDRLKQAWGSRSNG